MTSLLPEGSLAGRRVAVALSGGVDSAVTAALLKQGGADVFGVTMLLKKEDRPDDARAVAKALGIDLHIVDLCEKFEAHVVSAFVDAYKKGLTPNPCALCNRWIKFGDLMGLARSLGAEALATGHYVRRIEKDGEVELHRAADFRRDQSYFLFALSREQIAFGRFPLGGADKADVRAFAAKIGLPVAAKPDSQDICFVPTGDYAAFVTERMGKEPAGGEIVDEAGRLLGRHSGIIHYTVGQRRGLALGARKGESNAPLFVLSLDAEANKVVVGPRRLLARSTVDLKNVNWLADEAWAQGVPVTVKLRSSQNPVPARFERTEEGGGRLTLDEPVYGVSPGQAGVFYHDTRLLGGGWIV